MEEDFGLGQDPEEAWEIPIHSAGTSHGFPEGGGLACTDQKLLEHTPCHIMAIPTGGGHDKMSGMGRGGGQGQGVGRGGQGRGRMGGSGLGPGEDCRCPQCGYTMLHQVGVPCFQQTCPKCGSKLVRP
ncbi:MAG TPA: hypothetical protein VMW67_02385 [Desulfobacteria bacterium]|nr:hypothetical protein [Desulfobacteria bacterium]